LTGGFKSGRAGNPRGKPRKGKMKKKEEGRGSEKELVVKHP